MSDYIETTIGTRGGKPRITGTRITVADIVLMHRRLGRALEEISGSYDLPLADKPTELGPVKVISLNRGAQA
jgi:uncharacterized protein (DUF433 family)